MKVATSIRVATFGLLALAACDACSGGKITIKPAPVVQWDGGADDATHACAVLAAAGCPAGSDPNCAAMFRADQASGPGSMFDPACVIQAGPVPSALKGCGFTCGAEP